MSNPSPGGSLLEGLLGGGEAGYGFRENIKANRRKQKLDEELATLRQLEEQRAQAASAREQTRFQDQQTTFEQGQSDRARAEALRAEVGRYLQAPTGFRTPGQFISGKPATRMSAPLSPEANTAMEVGRTLGQFAGADLTDEESLLVGTGMVPGSAVQPKAYHPRTREEYLSNLRYSAGLRPGPAGRSGGAGAQGMTRAQAAAVVDRLDTQYSEWGATGITKHYLAPAQRIALIDKVAAGTATAADFPPLPTTEAPAAPGAPAPAPSGPGLLSRVGNYLGHLWGGTSDQGQMQGVPGAPAPGGGTPTLVAPTIRATAPGAPVAPAQGAPVGQSSQRQGAIDEARSQVAQFRDVPPAQIEDALRQEGFTEDEIRQILSTTSP